MLIDLFYKEILFLPGKIIESMNNMLIEKMNPGLQGIAVGWTVLFRAAFTSQS